MFKHLIPKHFHPVTLSEINQAWTQVWRELEVMGFACPRLATCQVYLGIVHTAYGYQLKTGLVATSCCRASACPSSMAISQE